MCNQRRILQIKWNNFITNEKIAKIVGIHGNRTAVRQRMFRLSGHVICLNHHLMRLHQYYLRPARQDMTFLRAQIDNGLAVDLVPLGFTTFELTL